MGLMQCGHVMLKTSNIQLTKTETLTVRVKESKNTRQISKKIFAFAFAFGRSEHGLRRVQWKQTALGSDYTSITVQ